MRLWIPAIVLSLILSGSAFARDLPTDIPKLRQLATHGDREAQYRLAYRYETGSDAPQNRAAAIIWYTKAAEHGHRGAQRKLCFLYAQPLHLFDIKDAEDKDGAITQILPAEGTKKDVAQTLKWCRIGAGLRDVDSSYPIWVLGLLYARGGEGLKPDLEEAYFWLAMAPKDEFFKAVKGKLTHERRRAVDARLRDWRNAHPASVTINPR